MRTTSYTPELIARLRTEYDAGKPARAIAHEHGVARDALMRHLRNAGVAIRNQGLTEEQAKQAATLYRSGMTQAQVAARFGVSQKTTGRYLRLLGVQMPPPLVSAAPSD
jgi:hypothetical protein